jgi:hypothetical protein
MAVSHNTSNVGGPPRRAAATINYQRSIRVTLTSAEGKPAALKTVW